MHIVAARQNGGPRLMNAVQSQRPAWQAKEATDMLAIRYFGA
jgi:hypothetical protein